MDINATLIGQAIAMLVFVWFCMKFIWPPLMQALEDRRKQVADGIAAGEKGRRDLESAPAAHVRGTTEKVPFGDGHGRRRFREDRSDLCARGPDIRPTERHEHTAFDLQFVVAVRPAEPGRRIFGMHRERMPGGTSSPDAGLVTA